MEVYSYEEKKDNKKFKVVFVDSESEVIKYGNKVDDLNYIVMDINTLAIVRYDEAENYVDYYERYRLLEIYNQREKLPPITQKLKLSFFARILLAMKKIFGIK